MELHGWRTPCGKGAGRLAARQTERACHRVRIEVKQSPHRRRTAERPDNSWSVPALLAKYRIVETDADTRRDFAAGNDRSEQLTA